MDAPQDYAQLGSQMGTVTQDGMSNSWLAAHPALTSCEAQMQLPHHGKGLRKG